MINAYDLAQSLRPLASVAFAYENGSIGVEGTQGPENTEIFQGRGGKMLISLADAFAARLAIIRGVGLLIAAAPMVAIADAFDANELDDEARKFWGRDLENTNETPPIDIELVCTDGGSVILTLAHALEVRAIMQGAG
jgi:hypothetical protein